MSRKNQQHIFIVLILFIIVAGVGTVFLVSHGNPDKRSQQTGKHLVLPATSPAKTDTLSASKGLPVTITIPEGAGHIVEGYSAGAGNKKVIIHLQDIHTNYEAQKNSSRIIESLIKEKSLKLIMVEGGWGNVSLSYLRAYADKDRKIEVAEDYLKAGKISGEEYLDIISDYEMDLEGLEEEELYKANLDIFFKIEEFRKKGSEELGAISDIVDKLKGKMYSQKLLELEKAQKDYEEERITLSEYYDQLNNLAQKIRVNLASYPNFNSFMQLAESEKHINFPAVEKERSRLIEKLSNKLPKQKLADLVTKSLEFRLNKLTPSQYHGYLTREAEEAGENLDAYSNLKKYVVYVASHEDINTAKLFEEADDISALAKEKLLTDARQKQLGEISDSIRVLDNFLNLKLIPKDFEYYKQHKNNFNTGGWIDFIQKLANKYKIRTRLLKPAYTVDKNIPTLVRFYELANERDDTFVANAIKLMNEKGQDIAVLIAGGFHTPSLKQKLRECGISYIVVAPHTTQQTDPEQYRYILQYKSGKAE